ncbi:MULTISPECIES: AzlC family ABC transporter permease [Shouchella]|uniref:AzlC family ABC transporter permease n=2 Tax=Shouchella TaxID=2893057 RepID=A0ABY7VZW9_9BACI|nr:MULTISPECIES: AzlC family ABC transporter permease [Shouchella]MED4129677.1 AzlC family ABC transporter permease [Shouchella miscanthi]WDF02258.1 AzlC family ABC transporter permease [Shouchella hunanensis]
MKNSSTKAAIVDGLPIAIAIGSYGISYGVLAHQADFTILTATVMSMLIFAGSVQLVAVAMYAAGATIPAILFAAFLLNLRDFLYGMDLARDLKKVKQPWRFFGIFGISDEPYLLAKARFIKYGTDIRYFLTVTFLFYAAWVSSSFIGVWVGDQIDPIRFGLDLAFPAAFTALLVPALTHKAAWLTVGTAIIITIIAEWIAPNNGFTIILVGLLAPLVGIFTQKGEQAHA